MYVCYYTYPGTQTSAVAPSLSAQPTLATIPPTVAQPTPVPAVTETLLIPVTSPQTLQSQAALSAQGFPYSISRSLKRPSEDLMSASPMMTNGTGISPNQSDHDAKKVKLDSQECSKVIHIRGIPENVTDAEIVQLGLPFGKVTNILRVKKSQAFLELEDEQQAATMVSYHASNTCTIRGKTIFIQFSKHKQLVVDQANSAQNASAKAAVLAANDVKEAGCILRVIIENMIYPVDVPILKQVFSKFGSVLKIITFTKNGTFQALIQYADAVSASAAKLSLDGQNIYNGCCTLKIDYSNLSNLNVKYNNEKSFDFTKVDQLGAGGDAMASRQMIGVYTGQLGSQEMMAPTLLPQGLGTAPLTAYGTAAAVGHTPIYASNYGSGMQAQMPQLAGNYSFPNSALARMAMPMQGVVPGMAGSLIGGSSVILVSNLNEEMATPEALFTLFGVYGDVHRVKILYNKKDNALIQLADPGQALQAIQNLDKQRVWGKQIRVAASKHNMVQMPREGQPDAGLTKDFTNSPLHRFKRPGSKNCLNIFPPSAVLHLSNIPPTVSEEDIKSKFDEVGTVVAFRFFPKDRKMALIEMKTVEEAIEALVKLHNLQLSENNHLRVSFSKSTIN